MDKPQNKARTSLIVDCNKWIMYCNQLKEIALHNTWIPSMPNHFGARNENLHDDPGIIQKFTSWCKLHASTALPLDLTLDAQYTVDYI